MKKEKAATIVFNKYKKARHRTSMILTGFIAFIVLGYALFFTSKVWYPEDSDLIRASQMNVARQWDSRQVTLIDWEYSKTQSEMEILLTIKNMSFDGINTYDITALDRKNGYLETSLYLQEKDLYVIRITDVPDDWSEISLQLRKEDTNALRFYTNKRDVETTDKIEDLTYAQYMIEQQNGIIEGYQQMIDAWNEQIQEEKQTIENCKAEIKELKESEKYQTDQEQRNTEQLIAKANTQINTSNSNISNYESQIEEYKERIKNARLQIEEYK